MMNLSKVIKTSLAFMIEKTRDLACCAKTRMSDCSEDITEQSHDKTEE
ncbi:rCG59148 [Rattus norvegicus]|uniref:RCG59148 n=1 Tax=Rattus norvegicus TaxID=10116 RepID=A6KIT8_RAT|nr:rCG59148 [Rattus norvegicus]